MLVERGIIDIMTLWGFLSQHCEPSAMVSIYFMKDGGYELEYSGTSKNYLKDAMKNSIALISELGTVCAGKNSLLIFMHYSE